MSNTLFGVRAIVAVRNSEGASRKPRLRPSMADSYTGAAQFVPRDPTLPRLRSAAQSCRGCDLYRHATQAVLGEIEGDLGSSHAAIMMIGEQPGDKEDLAGHPFVGPAGRLLNQSLEQAGIDRNRVYITNVVKHFKWEPRGKIRLHKKPSVGEVQACRPWLDAELKVVRPKLIVCLGAVAAQGLLGSRFRVTQSHGKLQHAANYPPILATTHPAAILRARTDVDRHAQLDRFVEDLRKAAKFLTS